MAQIWEGVNRNPVADPGFPVRGANPIGEGANIQHRHFSVKTCAKIKK